MPRITTVVADDDRAAREGVLDLLAHHDEVDVVDTCTTGDEVLAAIRQHHPDLLLVDVEIPGRGGFEIAHHLRETLAPEVIFVTKNDHYAVQAFETHALDFLLKPVSPHRFNAAIRYAIRRIRSKRDHRRLRHHLNTLLDTLDAPTEGVDAQETYLERILVRAHGRLRVVEVNDIRWVEAAGNYALIHTTDGEAHMHRISMADLEASLDPSRFLRVHRSYIVHVDRVREIESLRSGDSLLVLDDDTEIRSSRSYGDERRRIFAM